MAHGLCVQIVKQQPEHADAYFLLGIINSEVGQFGKAIKLIEKAIGYNEVPEYFAYLAKCYSLQGDMTSALDAIENAPLAVIEQPHVLDTVGVALSRIGLHQKAIEYFEKALSFGKPGPVLFYNYAVSCKFDGQFSKALVAFDSAISLDPLFYQAHFARSDLGGTSVDNNHIAQLKSLLEQKIPVEGQLHLAHALAKEYEALRQFDDAFKVLKEAKDRKLNESTYDFSRDAALFDAVTQFAFTTNECGVNSNRPIFIVGMPRSGTTLVERIISNHSKVASGGELQDFGVAVKELTNTPTAEVLDLETLEAATKISPWKLGNRYLERTRIVGPKSPHFIDKLPFNFFYINLIRRALPNAKIVFMLRNPMDTCIGNFRQLFSINSPYYGYSFDLLNVGRFYAEFYRLAMKWKEANDSNVMLLEYESLIGKPEKVIPELISFCGLDWQEQCLHVEKNTAPVSTASKVQVREPINSRSVARWKKFQNHTEGLEKFLAKNDIPFK